MLTLDSTVAEFRQGGFLVKVSSQCCLQDFSFVMGAGVDFIRYTLSFALSLNIH